MTETKNLTTGAGDDVAVDVFAVARWFDELWNSTAKAVSSEMVEWQCTTWGSGRGSADRTETATFRLVAEVFGLHTGRNYDERDELLVWVPVDRFPDIVRLVNRIGEEAESWPWLREEDIDRQIALAAAALERPVAAVAEDDDLLEALRIE